jgi:hypothetical protein
MLEREGEWRELWHGGSRGILRDLEIRDRNLK